MSPQAAQNFEAAMPVYREVPAHTSLEFSAKATAYCVIVVVYNEGERFIRQLREMSKKADLADIIVAERLTTDGSTSPQWLRSCRVRALLTTDEVGAASGMRMGLAYALQQGYSGVIVMDGNGKDAVGVLPEFIRKLEQGVDFVQGSRFMPGGFHKNTPLSRVVGIRLVMGPLLWLGSGYWFTDAMNGFRGYSRKYLLHPSVEPLRSCFTHFNVQMYLSLRAPALKLRVSEIPVSRVYPDDGTVPTKVTGLTHQFHVLREMVETVLGRYNPPNRQS